MRKFAATIFYLWVALAIARGQGVPLSEALNTIPTATTFTSADQVIAMQGGIGKKVSGTLFSSIYQTFDADLESLASASATGTWYYRSAGNTWSPVVLGSGLTFSGGTLSASASGGGTWGSITGTLSSQTDLQSALDAKQPLDGDLTALAASPSVGTWYYKSATNTWNPVVIGSGLDFSGGTLSAMDTGGGGTWGSITGTLSAQTDLQTALNAKQPLDGDLTSLAATTGVGSLYYKSATDTWSPVTIGSTLSFASGTLAVGTVPATSVSFSDPGDHWTATNVDAALAELADVNGLGPNTAASKVDWSQIKGMPPAFADGTDDGASGGSGTLSIIKENGVTVGTTMTTLDFLGADFDLTESPTGEANISIANDAITFAKMQNIATGVLLGRSTASTGDVETISVGAGLSLAGGTLSATGSGSSVAWGSITGTLSAQTDLQAALAALQPLDADLTSIAAISATGSFYYRSAASTWSPVVVGGGLVFTGGTISVGDLSGTYQPLDADLMSLAGASGTNTLYYRSATNTWSPVTVGTNLTFAGGTLSATGATSVWGAITGTLSAQTDLQAALDGKQPIDADLTSLAAASVTGNLYYRSATNTWSPVSVGSGLTFSGGTLSSSGGAAWGAITGTLSSQNDLQTALDAKQPLDGDLTSLAGISATGSFYYRNAANTWSPVAVGAGLTFSSGTLSSVISWGSISGTLSSQTDLQTALDARQPLDADLTSLAGLSTTGSFYYRSAANTWTPVTVGSGLSFSSGSLTATAFTLDIDGLPATTEAALDGDDVINISVDGVEQKITSDDWRDWLQLQNFTFTTLGVTNLNAVNFKVLDAVNQSHGLTFNVSTDLVANKSFTYAGAFNFAMTLTADTSVVFPTTGTLATTAQLGQLTSSDDPDISTPGALSWDTDGWLRAFDGTNQVAVGQKIDTVQITVVAPNDLVDSERDAFWTWSNESGMNFIVTGWKGWSDTDNTTLNIEEINADGTGNVTVDAVEIATNGTGLFTGADTAISGPTIENGHVIQLDFDDTDTPGQVKMTIVGYYDANVN